MNLNIIYSLPKTSSTTLFSLLINNEIFPVCHSHDMIYLNIFDYYNSDFINYIYNLYHKYINYKNINNNIINLTLKFNSLDETKQFLKIISCKVIGIFRNPIKRDISQLMQGTDLNYYIINLNQEINNDKNSILKYVLDINQTTFSEMTECNIIKNVINIIQNKNKLLSINDVFLLLQYFFNDKYDIYTGYINNLDFLFNIKKLSFIDQDIIYINQNFIINMGIYNINKNNNFMFIKMENLNTNKKDICKFFNIKENAELPHEKNCESCNYHLFVDEPKVVKKLLYDLTILKNTKVENLLSNPIIRNLNYKY
jgi:hypothetical protein